jgi:hypothetical protein
MPITLAQAQVNTLNDVDFAVIDNLRRYSWLLLDQIVFDDAATPGTGGGTLTYGYTRLSTAAAAAFRALQHRVHARSGDADLGYTVDLKPLGGAFTVDRVLANLGPAASNEVTFQMQQLLTSIQTRFQQEVILGDTAVDSNGFDGLDKALATGTATELSTATNWATVATQVAANQELDKLDEWLSRIVPSHVGSGDQGAPGALPAGRKAILGNTKSIFRLKSLARWAALATSMKDDLGREISMYGDWVLVDLGDRADGGSPIIPISSNATAVYAVTFGLDAFHGVSVANSPLVASNMPDFSTAGAIKSGEVEMGPLAMVLKNTKSAGVYRNITVQ